MYGKIFIVIMIITISCDLSLGRVLNCEDGEIYWCSSEKAAKRCGKTEYCQNLKNPEDDGVDIRLVVTGPPIPYHVEGMFVNYGGSSWILPGGYRGRK